MAFILETATNQGWVNFRGQEITVAPKLVFAHHLNNPTELDKLQRRGENGRKLSFLPKDPIPFSGYAANSCGNGQHQLVIQFRQGKTLSAMGWHLNGDPNESKVKNGMGFILETDDPQVGFFHEDGFEIAYKRKGDNGKQYRQCFLDGSHISYHAKDSRRDKTYFKNHKQNGLWKSLNAEGSLIREAHHNNGKAQGTIREWHGKGNPRQIIPVENSNVNGMWTEYDDQGKLLAIRNFSHGKAETK